MDRLVKRGEISEEEANRYTERLNEMYLEKKMYLKKAKKRRLVLHHMEEWPIMHLKTKLLLR